MRTRRPPSLVRSVRRAVACRCAAHYGLPPRPAAAATGMMCAVRRLPVALAGLVSLAAAGGSAAGRGGGAAPPVVRTVVGPGVSRRARRDRARCGREPLRRRHRPLPGLGRAGPGRDARRPAAPAGTSRHVRRGHLRGPPRPSGTRAPWPSTGRRRLHRRGHRAARPGGAGRLAHRGHRGRHGHGGLQRRRARRPRRASSTSRPGWRSTRPATSSSPTPPTAGCASCPPPAPRSSGRP